MTLPHSTVELVLARLNAMGVRRELRVQVIGSNIQIDRKKRGGSYPLLRLHRVGANVWQRQEASGAGRRWLPRGRRTSLERLVDRWQEPLKLWEDLRFVSGTLFDTGAATPAEKTLPRTTGGLPRLTWDGDAWRGKDQLESWKGFACRWDDEGRRLVPRRSVASGRLDVRIDVDGDMEREPSRAQRAAYSYLRSNERTVTTRVLSAVFKFYRAQRGRVLESADDTDPRTLAMLAPLKSAAGLRERVSPQTVHVLDVESDGIAYVGLGFGCVWDFEHGLGVLLHRNRVIEVGEASIAFEAGAARRYAERARRSKRGARAK